MQPAVMMISVYVLPLPQFEPVALVNGNSSAAMAAVVGYVFVGPSIKKVVVMWWEDSATEKHRWTSMPDQCHRTASVKVNPPQTHTRSLWVLAMTKCKDSRAHCW
jgi:hypothetical protein